MTEGDWKDVDCSRWREAISALADGEQADIDERLVPAHIARCPACQSYRETIQASPGGGTEVELVIERSAP